MEPTSPSSTGISEYLSPNTPQNHYQHSRHESKSSITSKTSDSAMSARSHQEYLDKLVPPSQELVKKITIAQEHNEEEFFKKKLSADNLQLSQERRRAAASMIQRNYRGHRERRMLKGMSLDPSARWLEAIKEARYRQITEPRARVPIEDDGPDVEVGRQSGASIAKQNWKKISLITRRAGGDEDSDSDSEDDNVPQEGREAYRTRRLGQKLQRQKAAKMMDLQYFLEMVDLKHRYGANLRTYHEEWKKAETNENFFYWLDHGKGRFIDCQGCAREVLDREQVRYLSKEERLNYLVEIDKDGRLCWAKNGVRIDTTDKFRDSIHGIVPESDTTPSFTPLPTLAVTMAQDSLSEGSSAESSIHEHDTDGEDERVQKHIALDHDKQIKKVKHVSAATIFDKLLRGTVKENTWIFVADTNFRLYVGVKQSGTFQHSSFLHGSRISAAGSIKIKNGRLSNLSPLSGHYRPPVANFKAFISSLKDAGADMSHVSISRSYAILVGLEAYVRSRKRGKKLIQKLMHGHNKMLSPEVLAKQEEDAESAVRERRFLDLKQQVEMEDKHRDINAKLRDKLHIGVRFHASDAVGAQKDG